jgi:hypothetical protein
MSLSPRVFYHAFLWGDLWKLLVQEQMLRLHCSGLLDKMSMMTIGVSAFDDNDYKWMKSLWSGFHNVNVVRTPHDLMPKEERATLMLLKDWCDQSNEDAPILYFHTKGLTRTGYNVDLWRLCMEYYNIDKWRHAISALNNGWDAYGINLRDNTEKYFGGNYLHYSGNFWWARSFYIKSLDKTMLTGSNRWEGEFWIGSKGSREKMFNAYESSVDHYDEEHTIDSFIKPREQF